MPTPGVQLDTRQFAGTREVSELKIGDLFDLAYLFQISLHASLSGGDGDTAWQHTQLFRSSTNKEEDGPKLRLTVHFKPI